MAGRGHRVRYNGTSQRLGAVARKVDKTDFPLRIRNGMAADLRTREIIKDDDYAIISRGRQVGKRAAKKSRPEFGIVIATNERLRIATAETKTITDVRLETIRLTHDEDNVLTMTIRPSGTADEPLTLVFAKRSSEVAQFLRDKFSDHKPGGSTQAGLRKFLPGS